MSWLIKEQIVDVLSEGRKETKYKEAYDEMANDVMYRLRKFEEDVK